MSQKVISEMIRPVSCRRLKDAYQLKEENRRLFVYHLILLAHHS